ncbi:hypothetical protein Smp_199480 [Schistosoma mansoni]|uniref:hypothetical protein n=1 Tax=Schistosoma mansoni TaxID=6183 RepID=UPI00022C8359|nr:hypothetical protein Smp_199480 [Schistosoma mansoni]|eukprot:XP_018647422.1 hypothetical protein Smp_199480 [Schistosoma mansoni]
MTPFEFWKSLLGCLLAIHKKLNVTELFESSTIYHLIFQLDDIRRAGRIFFLTSDPKYQDSGGEYIYRRLVRDIIYTHKKARSEFHLPPLMRNRVVPTESERAEALQSLRAASLQQATGHFAKAKKLLEHAFKLDPDNIDVLIALADGLILTAEHLYTKALIVDPSIPKACLHRERLMPIVEEIDQRM